MVIVLQPEIAYVQDRPEFGTASPPEGWLFQSAEIHVVDGLSKEAVFEILKMNLWRTK